LTVAPHRTETPDQFDASLLALLRGAPAPLGIHELSQELSKQLPERERAAGRTVSDYVIRASLQRLVAAGLVETATVRRAYAFHGRTLPRQQVSREALAFRAVDRRTGGKR
jgi:hypothetical protein